jgi:ribosome-associated heat shock protein Hsp15
MIFKQREIAKEICDKGFVKINGQCAKPAKRVSVGDVIDIEVMDKRKKYKVVSLPNGNVKKGEVHLYYQEVDDPEGS